MAALPGWDRGLGTIGRFSLDSGLGYTYIVFMGELRFEWDRRKDRANVTKHGISFEEARAVFYDEHAVQFYDPDNSEEEDRFILIGMSIKLRVVVVCHCFREDELVVRIISARRANRAEENDYWRQRR